MSVHLNSYLVLIAQKNITFSLGSNSSNSFWLVSMAMTADISDESTSLIVSMVFSYSTVIILARSTDLKLIVIMNAASIHTQTSIILAQDMNINQNTVAKKDA